MLIRNENTSLDDLVCSKRFIALITYYKQIIKFLYLTAQWKIDDYLLII